MQTRVVDFEILTRHYLNYQTGVKEINVERKRFIDRLNPLKMEMESIIKLANSGLVVDNTTQKSRNERFQQLQQEAMVIDEEFQHRMKGMRGELNSKIYDELSKIITDWSIDNSIDLISGKMEIVYANPKFESTNDILELLKKRGLFVEDMVNVKESV